MMQTTNGMENDRCVFTCGVDNKAPINPATGKRTMTHVYNLLKGTDGYHLFCYELGNSKQVSHVGPCPREELVQQLDALAMGLCVYHVECKGEGKHQCPKCKKWYCDECREMFLPIDPRFWSETALMCPQCHYNQGRG